MSQITFRSSAHLTLVHLLRNAGVRARSAWRDLKGHWAETTVIALLLLAGIVIRIARMAAANPEVAQVLSQGARLLAPPGMHF